KHSSTTPGRRPESAARTSVHRSRPRVQGRGRTLSGAQRKVSDTHSGFATRGGCACGDVYDLRVGRRSPTRGCEGDGPEDCGYQPPCSRSEVLIAHVALFLPFGCNKRRQGDAKRDTTRKRESKDFHWVKRAIRQPHATRRKQRLTLSFPAVNRRVAGSSPA